MDWDQRCIRFCGALVLAAVALRLWAGGALVSVGQALTDPAAASFLVYLNTGRSVRTLPGTEPVTPAEPEAPERIPFCGADAGKIRWADPPEGRGSAHRCGWGRRC